MAKRWRGRLGGLPFGVYKSRSGGYQAKAALGTFSTMEEAAEAARSFKEMILKWEQEQEVMS